MTTIDALPHQSTARRILPAHVLVGPVASLASLAYVFVIPVGLPYDEPSHWGFVKFLADHWSLPVIGDRSVGYEAQMGPVAYLPQAAVLALWRFVGGSEQQSIFVVRALGAAVLFALWLLVRRLISLGIPDVHEAVASLGAAVAVLNPMVVAMTMSIQNDSVSILLLVCLLLLTLRSGDHSSLGQGVRLGVLGGLTVLAKLSLVPAVAVILLWPLLRNRATTWRSVAVAVGATLAVSGWWFIRNLLLYRDITGRVAVERLDVTFPALGFSLSTITYMAQSIVTYLTIPVEYYRNFISVSLIAGGSIALAVALVAVFGGASLWKRWSDPVSLLAIVGAAGLVSWAFTAVVLQAVAFRTAYSVLPLWGLVVAALGSGGRTTDQARVRYWALIGVVVLLIPLHAWILVAASDVAYPPGVDL